MEFVSLLVGSRNYIYVELLLVSNNVINHLKSFISIVLCLISLLGYTEVIGNAEYLPSFYFYIDF